MRKLIFATENVPIPKDINIILDMTGYKHNQFDTIYNLIAPMVEIGDPNFSNIYCSKLLQDNRRFMDVMKIVYNLYMDKSVLVYYMNNYYQNECIAQLQFFLEQRYGLIPCYMFSEVDFYNNMLIETDFSINGLKYLDMDKARYADMLDSRGFTTNRIPIQQVTWMKKHV